VQIELRSGAVAVEATPRRGGGRLVVSAGPWRVEVVGTRFRVARLPEDEVRVAVEEGRVRVVGPGTEAVLEAGTRFDSRPLREEPSDRPPAVAPPPEPDAPPVSTKPQPARRRRRAPEPQAAAPEPPAVDEPPSPKPADPPHVARDRRQADLIARAATEGDVDARVRTLDRAAALGPPLDEVAAYRAARALQDAGRAEEAAVRYAELIARWPSGELTQVASIDRIETLLAAGDVDGAATAASALRAAYPAAASRPEVRFLFAEVARSRGAYAQAAELYRIAARARRFADSASYREALCLARAGEIERARASMRAYLERFPGGLHAEAARRALETERVKP